MTKVPLPFFFPLVHEVALANSAIRHATKGDISNQIMQTLDDLEFV